MERISGAMPLPVAHGHGREHGGACHRPTTRRAARRATTEIVRRYFQTAEEIKRTGVGEEALKKIELLDEPGGRHARISRRPARRRC